MSIELHLPLPPSANALWARTKTGMRKSDQYKAWLTEAGWMLKKQKPGKIHEPFICTILAVRPEKDRDLDNAIKAVLDLLQKHGIVRNDSDCDMVSARWVTAGQGVTVYVDRSVREDQ